NHTRTLNHTRTHSHTTTHAHSHNHTHKGKTQNLCGFSPVPPKTAELSTQCVCLCLCVCVSVCLCLCLCVCLSVCLGGAVAQEAERSFSNQEIASSIPCRSVLEQDTESLIAPDVQCAI